MIMAQSLYKLLARRKPEAALHVLAPAWSKPVLELMPEVSCAIEQPIGHGKLNFSLRRELGYRLRSERYSQAIVLPRSFKSALVPYFASIPVRTGFRGEWRYGVLNDRRPFSAEVLDRLLNDLWYWGSTEKKLTCLRLMYLLCKLARRAVSRRSPDAIWKLALITLL